MLIEFRVENHRSIREEQALTWESARLGDDSDPRPRLVEGSERPLLPAAALYGANASGKSNVLSALSFMWEAVRFSHRFWEPETGIPRTPFAWGDMRKAPSTFEVSFLVDRIRYQYGFVVDDAAIVEEWLYAFPNGRQQTWFERDRQTFHFKTNLHGPNETIKGVTPSTSLFLSVASQHQHPQLLPVNSWFRNIFPFNIRDSGVELAGSMSIFSPTFSDGPSGQGGARSLDANGDGTQAKWVRQLLQAADIGIVDVKEVTDEDRPARRPRIMFKHKIDDEDSWLDLRSESDGTKTLFKMAPLVFAALQRGGVLVVDELESSLHPLLALAIVQLFNSPKANPNGAQIVFTTHDTNLLYGAAGDPPLRRDQVWFTEKGKEGATRLYPLTDYKPRKAENLERGYLQGRYGAIPFLGNIAGLAE